MFDISAMYTLGYLYLRRQPLSWSQTTYGVLVGTRTLVSGWYRTELYSLSDMRSITLNMGSSAYNL